MYKLILAMRYLFRRRITYFAVLAVALCVFIVVVVMTVMTGLVGDFKEKNHEFAGDCVVGSESLVGFAYYEDFIKKLEAGEVVESISEVIKSYALLSPRNRDISRGVEVMGIDPVKHSRATGFADTLYHRRNDEGKAFVPKYDPNLPGCVLGIDLALERGPDSRYTYHARPVRQGFAITCFPLTARGALVLGTSPVNTKTFYYSDHSQSGLARVDDSIIYLPFDQAQALCGMDGPTKRINAIHIKFADDVKLQAGCNEVRRLWKEFKAEKAGESQAYLFDSVTVQSWLVNRRTLIAAMEKEETMMGAMFGFVGIVVVFIVLVVFYMLISHKSKDIGVLRSIGVSSKDIVELFAGFAAMVGAIGSSLGVLAGWQFLLRINQMEDWLFERTGFQIWDRTMFAIDDIPSRVSPKVLAVIVVSAIAACLIGALIPSWQAIRLKPVETLQVNQL
ncbi:MAG: ABC transporter permease [Planctomycetota bacterium]|jgi:lipoprotein-releasing system permease protein